MQQSHYLEQDEKFIKQALELQKESHKNGAFPAGALITKNNTIISKATATKFPNIHLHPESKAIDSAMEKIQKQLNDCTLYTSIQPCLMCMSRAYWAGIRRIIFAIKKETVPHELCYESKLDHCEVLKKFNVTIDMIHYEKFQKQALEVVTRWIQKTG